MRQLYHKSIPIFLILFIAACTSPGPKNTPRNSATDSTDKTWRTYTDTVNHDFILSFKYPAAYVAEAIENGRCIGKPVKPMYQDDPRTNSLDCCIWMTSVNGPGILPIDTLITI